MIILWTLGVALLFTGIGFLGGWIIGRAFNE